MTQSYALGLDPGKSSFCAAMLRSSPGEEILPATEFPTTRSGFTALLERLRDLLAPGDTLVVGIEASGSLDDNLLAFFASLRESFAVEIIRLDPAQVAHFSGPRPIRDKTDRTDARRIARFTLTYVDQLHRFQHDPRAQALTRLIRERGHLVADATGLKNRLQDRLLRSFPEFTTFVTDPTGPLALALLDRIPTARHAAAARPQRLTTIVGKRSALPLETATALVSAAQSSVACACEDEDAEAIRFCIAQLRLLTHRLDTIYAHLKVYAETQPAQPQNPATASPQPSPDFAEQIRLADSLPGVALVGAASLVLRCGGIARFTSRFAFAAQLGVCPDRRQSGSSLHCAHLTHRGDRGTRPLLYLMTLAACRKDLAMAFLRWRLLRSGLSPKQAIAACMNRLARWLYAVVSSRTPYDPAIAIANAQRHHPTLWHQFLRENPKTPTPTPNSLPA